MATKRTEQRTTSEPDRRKTAGSISDKRGTDLQSSLTGAQRAKDAQMAAKARTRADVPEMVLEEKDGILSVKYSHDEPDLTELLLMGDLATTDPHFFGGIERQIAAIGAHGKRIDQGASNFLLSVVRAVQPRDEVETLLAVQMGAIHAATMMMARRLNHVETIQQQDSAERSLNKLARTFALQMEALKRHRSGGEQKITVEHVTVNAGGQAIVGAVEQRWRGQDEK